MRDVNLEEYHLDKWLEGIINYIFNRRRSLSRKRNERRRVGRSKSRK